MALLGGLVHGVGIQNAAARSHSSAKPRHLTVAEEGAWFSDRSGDPRIVALIARLDGSVDETHVSATLSQALSEVPLWASHPSRAWAGSRHHVWTEHSFSSRELLTIASGGDEIVHELVERMRLSSQRCALDWRRDRQAPSLRHLCAGGTSRLDGWNGALRPPVTIAG